MFKRSFLNLLFTQINTKVEKRGYLVEIERLKIVQRLLLKQRYKLKQSEVLEPYLHRYHMLHIYFI